MEQSRRNAPLPWLRSKRAGLVMCWIIVAGQPYSAGKVAQRNNPRPKANCTIARTYFMAHPDGGMRTYNAARGDESSLKS
jgi:hypothetical protein